MTRNAFAFAAPLLAAAAFVAPASAQTAAPVAAAADSGQLEEIVVTAQRQSQSLQKVPIAVTAVSAESLAMRGIADTNALSFAVPNLTLPQNGVSITPFLRGVGSAQSNPNDEPSVATYIDGVYIPSPTGNIFSFNNIQRIEVLKGPQGTLFGRNATGGVIQIVTRDPQQTPLFLGSIGYGNYNTLDASGYATAGIAPNFAADIAVVYHNNLDGYGRDIKRNEDIFRREELGIRSKLLLTPGESTEIRLSLDYSKLNSTGTDYQLAQGVIGADGVTSYPGRRRTNTDFANVGNNEVYGAALRLDQDFGFARFVSISGYRHVTGDFHLDQDATPTPIVKAFINQFARNFSQEFQLLSPTDSKISWLLGAYYFDAKYAYTPLTIAGFAAAPFAALNLTGQQTTKSYSGYGQATLPVAEGTNITAGLRYTDEKQATVGGANASGLTIIPDIAQKQGIKKVTWRLAVDHQFGGDVLGYLSYNRGIKSGGFNMINAGTPGYRPEILDAYEIGLKTQLADRSVRLNTAGFYYKYRDIQVFSITGGGAVLTTNAAAARLWGFDADLQWKVSKDFSVSAGAGYIDSKYTSFPNATFTPASPTQGGQFKASATGNRLVYAPRFNGNLSLDYTIPSSIGEFGLNGTVAHQSNVFVSPDNRLQIPTYTVVNASIGWTSRDERFGIQLWAKNLFNEDYYANRTEQALGDIQYLAPPRTVGVKLSVKM